MFIFSKASSALLWPFVPKSQLSLSLSLLRCKSLSCHVIVFFSLSRIWSRNRCCLHSRLNHKTSASHESKCWACSWCFIPPSVLLWSHLRQGRPILWHTPRPHAHTKTVARFLSVERGCFYCDSILAERANSSAVWPGVCVYQCVRTHMYFITCLCLSFSLLWGKFRLL